MGSIGEWLNDEVYPVLFERVDMAFPEHNFKRYRNGWRSKTYLNGSPHPGRADKTVINAKAPYCIIEQGGECRSIFDYIKERDNLTDKQTLEKLSQLTGVALPENDLVQTENYRKKRVEAQILESAQNYFVFCLENSVNAQELKKYLRQSRGYSETHIRDMELGFIPSQVKLYKFLTETKKFKTDDVNRVVRLNNRIGKSHVLTIPYREPGGQIRGFIVRTVKDDIRPKYFYSTGLKKEDLLFNLEIIKGNKDLVIVEGVLDALNSEAHGINNVVALGGTTLNKIQVKEAVRRGAKRITLLLDNDRAGNKATLNALELLNKETDLPVFVAILPEGIKDPDQLIREKGPEPLQGIINKVIKGYLFKLNYITDKYAKGDIITEMSSKNWEGYLEEVIATARNIKNPIDKDLFVDAFLKVIDNYNISKKSLLRIMDKFNSDVERNAPSKIFHRVRDNEDNLTHEEYKKRFHKENDKLLLALIHRLSGMDIGVDLSDFGNVIGNVVGNDKRFNTDNGFDLDALFAGIKRGTSNTNKN